MTTASLQYDGARDEVTTFTGGVKGGVALVLRLEGLGVLAGAVLAYQLLDGNWWTFALLFLTPDFSMLGYVVGRQVGAFTYNLGHSYLSPGSLALAALLLHRADLLPLLLIWAAHIGFDRFVGYGLKYSSAFGATHLGWKGRKG